MSYNTTHSADWKFVRNIGLVVFGLVLAKVAFYFVATSLMPLNDTNSSQLVKPAQVSQVNAAHESSAPVRDHGQENR